MHQSNPIIRNQKGSAHIMLLYRVENYLTNEGLWYNTQDQSESKLAHNLNLSASGLPMFRDEAISNEHWKSAADSVDQLSYWFTKEDLEKLKPLGFGLYAIETDLVKIHKTELYEHSLFQEQKVLKRTQLDIDKIIKT